MIVPMSKVFLVARAADRRKLLDALGELGVVHLAPVDPARAKADEKTVSVIERLGRAAQILSEIPPAGPAPDAKPEAAAEEVLDIQRAQAERRSRLNALHRQYEQLTLWGETTLEQFARLKDAGWVVRLVAVPQADVPKLKAACVEVVAAGRGKEVLVALVDRADAAGELPEAAREIPLPSVDRPTLRAQAAQIEADTQAADQRLAELANLLPKMVERRRQLQQQAYIAVAERSGLAEEDLYAVQGWAPAERCRHLVNELAERGVPAGMETLEPDEHEQPPTLIRYPRWARPIKGLFDILETYPGYREADVSAFFMVALPLFAAMLIGDAGYGLLFVAAALGFYPRLVAKVGAPKVQLFLVFGLTTLAWGVLTGTYFGVTPQAMLQAGGALGGLGRVTEALALLRQSDPNANRMMLIKISFIIGTVHLTLARLRRALGLAPDQRFLAEIGWVGMLWGMLGLIWLLFFEHPLVGPLWVVWAMLACGGGLVILFGAPRRHPLARVGLGLASALLPTMSAFSDTISYVRLMAVGLASYYIAYTFNTLSARLAEVITWFGAAPILVLGHVMNIALAVIAIFAHGVRLNMLEFSSNAGVQWSGYPYEPFTKPYVKES